MPVRLIERSEPEQHFTEGEPDLEPPEELAVAELDEETQLEEDLDNEDVLEQDVDEDVLEATLEDLVHVADDDDEDDAPTARAQVEAIETDEVLDIVDVEESLDRILQARLAELGDDGSGDGPGADEADMTDPADDVVAPCGHSEFVCRGCFLVFSTVLLADPAGWRCHDCVS
ncbi:MAG TPA: hypothetical protein VMV14_08900 [Acidimicrobiales bacterium]|nr:hypothetical protein [Acidimicrobiales bacterium]